MVLLNVALTWAIPLGTLRACFFLVFAMVGFFTIVFCVSCLAKVHAPLFLLISNGFSLPFRVRELVRVAVLGLEGLIDVSSHGSNEY